MEVPAILTSGEKPKISVWLSSRHAETIKFFHCTVCGHKIFGFYNDTRIIMSGEGEVGKRSPIEIQCNGAITVYKNGRSITTRCKTIYRIC